MNVIIGCSVYDIEVTLVIKTHSPFDCFVTLLYLLCSFHIFFILQIHECLNALFGLASFMQVVLPVSSYYTNTSDQFCSSGL